MRFGKRLTELSQNGQVSQPYISYKELKHILGQLPRLVGSANDSSRSSKADSADSSGDEVPLAARNGATSSAASDADACAGPVVGSSASTSCKPSVRGQLEEQQRVFFSRISADVASALSHVQSIVAPLEAGIGDWQYQAAVCGLLFTPSQLEEVASNLPFEVPDQQAFVQWLVAFQPPGHVRSARQALAELYRHLSASLQVLLQYIEVNITAVRKILKKFEKKVPAEFRVQNAQSFMAHHDIFTSDLQDLLVAMVHMHRIVVIDMKSLDAELDVRSISGSPISFLGPETLQVLQRIKISTELREMITGQPVVRFVDVYATPNSDIRGFGARGAGMNSKSGAAATVAAADQAQGSGRTLMSQQVALNLGKAEMFQGPPKPMHEAISGLGGPTSPHAGGKPGASSKAGIGPTQPGFTGHHKHPVSRADGMNPGKAMGGATARGQSAQAATKAGGRRGNGGKGGKGGRGQRGSGSQPAQDNPNFTNSGQSHPPGAAAMNKSQGGYNGKNGRNSMNGGYNGGRARGNGQNGKNGMKGGFAQVQPQAGGASPDGIMQNMQCMVMMVPAGWNQQSQPLSGSPQQSRRPAVPPGTFKGSQNCNQNQVAMTRKGGHNACNEGGGYRAMPVMGMVPQNMDPEMAAAWRGMMQQQHNEPNLNMMQWDNTQGRPRDA